MYSMNDLKYLKLIGTGQIGNGPMENGQGNGQWATAQWAMGPWQWLNGQSIPIH